MVITADSVALIELPLEVIVEATGDPVAGARHAATAIDKGRHVVMVTKEADSVVGPYLNHLALQAGRVYTPVEGDQPALLIGLVSWARTLGLDIAAIGKSSEYDFVFDPGAGAVRWRDKTVDGAGFERLWRIPPGQAEEFLRRRADALRELPQRAPSDYCEMCVVANATGLLPDRPEFHAPHARPVELPDLLRPREKGGILSGHGKIEVFNCLRRPDEASFAGGVFVLAAGTDRQTWRLLKGKGIPVDRDDEYALLYNPSHLLGVEAPVTILSAALLGLSSGTTAPRPVADMAARAARHLPAGTELALGERRRIDGVEAILVPARRAEASNPVPFYLAAGGRLRRAAPAGTILTVDMIEPPAERALWNLRQKQDALFGTH